MDRAADLLLTGNLAEFANLSYLSATYLGAAIDCLKNLYAGLDTVDDRIAVDNMFRRFYIDNRAKSISSLNTERAAQNYQDRIDVDIADKEAEMEGFC